MSNINWQARVKRLAAAAQYARGDEAPWSGTSDQGSVPSEVMSSLCSLAQQIGHPVSLTKHQAILDKAGAKPCPGCGEYHEEIYGLTSPSHAGQGAIWLRDGMSPASTARVLGHELGHARVNTVLAQAQSALWVFGQLLCRGAQEEVACELGTAAFCQEVGIGTGAFLRQYIGNNGFNAHLSGQALSDAAVNAEMLHEAVTS